jgi:hypothetical protein
MTRCVNQYECENQAQNVVELILEIKDEISLILPLGLCDKCYRMVQNHPKYEAYQATESIKLEA